MKYLTFPLLALLTALSVGAQAATFGGLNITPRGPQNLNLETGVTDLPQGGTATDAKGGVTLNAQRMQLRPGQTLTAQDAVITVRQGGSIRAPQVIYDLKAGTVTASGGVTYNDVRLSGLQAPSMTLYVKPAFITASGGVKASRPQLNGSAMVFDLNTMQALISGPYQVRQANLNASAGAGSHILLAFAANRLTRATPNPDATTVGRFTPYLK